MNLKIATRPLKFLSMLSPRVRRGTSLLAVLFLPAIAFMLPQPGWSSSKPTMVMFSANWCASCRKVLPVAREIADQNNMTLMQIDVDSQDAPKQARNFGLSVPGDEPPQIYSLSRGRAVLIYNGKTYRSGSDADAIRAVILQNLQPLLGK